MTFQALLVTTDEAAAAVLAPVLSDFGLSVRRCVHAESRRELGEQKFDALVVDFDDVAQARSLLQDSCQASASSNPVTVALLREQSSVRGAFGAGAHFVLYKPITPAQAQATLRAATVLIKRERRRSLRVPVQVPVQIQAQSTVQIEGILLDLSQDGLEVLAAQPLCPSTPLNLQFTLPDSVDSIDVRGEVAWASPNGQCGVRFADLAENVRTRLAGWVAANAHRLPAEEPAPGCKLTDISSGGCYVETESPFPERSGVALRLSVGSLEVQVQGMVRVMHPGFGMGIEFAAHNAQARGELTNFIEFLIGFPGALPELAVTPLSLAPGAAHSDPQTIHQNDEFDDPLLDLLRCHESLAQEQFVKQLHQQRHLPAIPVA